MSINYTNKYLIGDTVLFVVSPYTQNDRYYYIGTITDTWGLDTFSRYEIDTYFEIIEVWHYDVIAKCSKVQELLYA